MTSELQLLTPIQRLQASATPLSHWIDENSPKPSRSRAVFNLFMECYGSKLVGSEAFKAKCTKVINKTSRLAAGIVILQRILDTKGNLEIMEAEESSCAINKKNAPPTVILKFDFCKAKGNYMTLSSSGERQVMIRKDRVSTFVHECIHAWHYLTNHPIAKAWGIHSAVLPMMDNGGEEMTITGNLHLENPLHIDFCCENAILQELNYPLRIDHRGIKEKPELHDLIRLRLLPRIREQAALGEIESTKKDDLNPLELALHLRMLSAEPEVLEEWMAIIRILVSNGCATSDALHVAFLENSSELIDLLTEAGAQPTPEMIVWAEKSADDRFDEMWSILKKHKHVVSLDLTFEVKSDQDPEFDPLEERMNRYFYERKIVYAKFIREVASSSSITASSSSQEEQTLSSEESSSASIPFVHPLPSTNYGFILKPDGGREPSKNYDHSPALYKNFADYCVNIMTYPRPFFTAIEVREFLLFSSSHAGSFSSNLADWAMEKLNLGNTAVAIDDFLKAKLKSCMEHQIERALLNPEEFREDINIELFQAQRFIDIPLLTATGDGLLQQINREFEGKYTETIESFKNEDQQSISEASCRFILDEWLGTENCVLRFEGEIWVNGQPTNNGVAL